VCQIGAFASVIKSLESVRNRPESAYISAAAL
jgi:hypothetical protein